MGIERQRLVPPAHTFVRMDRRARAAGGGPQQLPHLAPTYSGVLALITVGTEVLCSSVLPDAATTTDGDCARLSWITCPLFFPLFLPPCAPLPAPWGLPVLS